MTGILVSSFGYIATAGSQIFDKVLLSRTFHHPASFAFWTAILGLGVFVFLPFDFRLPELGQWPLMIGAGLAFQLGLVAYYNVASGEEISKASTVIGAITPSATLFFARWFLGEQLAKQQWVAFGFLVLGTILITYSGARMKNSKQLFWLSVLSGLLFALSAVMMKLVFGIISFIPGLVWTRIGGLMVAIFIFAVPKYRNFLINQKEQPKGVSGWLFLVGQGLGAVGFLLINLGIFMTSPTIVNALQGVRYATLFVVALGLSHWWPKVFQEPLTKRVIIKKSLGLMAIFIGLWAIVV